MSSAHPASRPWQQQQSFVEDAGREVGKTNAHQLAASPSHKKEQLPLEQDFPPFPLLWRCSFRLRGCSRG